MQKFADSRTSRRRRGIRGFTLVEMILVAGIISSIPTAQFAQVKAKANQAVEINNLRQIGQLLVQYQMDNGHYPKAAFYPKDPLAGDDSIRVILAGKSTGPAQPSRGVPSLGGIGGRVGAMAGGGGGVGGMFVAAAMPDTLQQKGLTYVYNDAIAGQRQVANPGTTWVLIDMTCVSAKVEPPYTGGYNILFADGHVITTPKLPQSITKLRTEVKE